MTLFSSRTLMATVVVCLVCPAFARAEDVDLPPIEAPPEGAAPDSGGFTSSAARPGAQADAQPPELIIPMPTSEAAPAPAAPPPEEPGYVPTRRAPPRAPAPVEPGVPPTDPGDVPPELLLPPESEPPPASPAVAAPAPATTPVAAATPPAPVAAAPAAAPQPEALAFDNEWRVRLLPFSAVGVSSDFGFAAPTETSISPQSLVAVGATLSVTSGPISIEGRFSDTFSQQRYLTRQLAMQGGLSALDVSEQKLNVDLGIGYEVMHHMDPKLAKSLAVTPFVGGAARLFVSDSLPMNVAGPTVGGRVAVAASNALVVSATYAFLPNLVGYQGPQLLFGAPRFDHTVDVDVSLRLFGAARAHLSYLSEYLTLTSAYRSYQTVGLGFDYGF